MQHPVPPAGHGIHGKITPGRIFPPVCRPDHDGMAAIRLHIPAQGGDFIRGGLNHRRHGAMGQPCGNGFDPGLLQRSQYLFRRLWRREVNIRNGAAHHQVPHHTPHQPGLRQNLPEQPERMPLLCG